jgi:serine/threonine protein kinase
VPLSATTKRRNRRRSKGVSLHGSQATLSILELMHAIINEPSPRLPRNKFDKEVEDFVGGCLEKDPEKRGQGGLRALFVSCFLLRFPQIREEVEEWNTNTFFLFAGVPLDPPLAHERRRYARLGGDLLTI